MLFFAGDADALVAISDVQRAVDQLTVAYEFIKLEGNGLKFGHLSYFEERKIVPLVIVPTLKHLFRQSPS